MMIELLFAVSALALSVQTSQGNSIDKDGEKCMQCPGSDIVWLIDGSCYCGVVAKNITSCVKSKNPAWPRRESKIVERSCGSPFNNKGYFDCFKANMDLKLHRTENTNDVVLECVDMLKSVGQEEL
ncbi:hypothetical protein HDV06_006086 [Boothiomyces sp. JEL0866]|nr:hypothetical protein HDV06_006036 [Boothiomyces sp. JEL0866]KAJ3324828.1 hypothetical protein HDV06_006086 [Boothiomyces sp. JEL0866]